MRIRSDALSALPFPLRPDPVIVLPWGRFQHSSVQRVPFCSLQQPLSHVGIVGGGAAAIVSMVAVRMIHRRMIRPPIAPAWNTKAKRESTDIQTRAFPCGGRTSGSAGTLRWLGTMPYAKATSRYRGTTIFTALGATATVTGVFASTSPSIEMGSLRPVVRRKLLPRHSLTVPRI